MKFSTSFRLFVVLFSFICVSVFAQQSQNALPPLPIPDSVVIKNLNVKNTEIRDLLQGMAVQYGLNLFLAPEVKGPVTVNFNNQPLKDALRVLLQGVCIARGVKGLVVGVEAGIDDGDTASRAGISVGPRGSGADHGGGGLYSHGNQSARRDPTVANR